MQSDRHEPTADDMDELERRAARYQAGVARRKPKKVADVMSQLLASGGYAQVQSADEINRVWRTVAGQTIAKHTRVGLLRRGVLEISVANSTWLQELTFKKRELLAKLRERLPDKKINDLRLRAGSVE